MHRRRLTARAVTACLAAAVLLGACGSDDDADTTLPPISTTSTTAAPTTTVPVTVTLPATTPATTTRPTTPATSAATTSTAAATTSTGESTTTTTQPPAGAVLVLRDNSIGDAVFGADPDDVVAYLRTILGAPTADTGWADPYGTFGVCPGTEVRGVTWDDLTLLFSDSSTVTEGRRHFFSWIYGPAFADQPSPAGPATAAGISLGSTVATLETAYPDVIINPADEIYDANFAISEHLTGFLTGSGPDDTVVSLKGGTGCGE